MGGMKLRHRNGFAKPKVIKTPQAQEKWRDDFRNFSMKVNFVLSLSKSMLEMLCATADGVQWDRALYRHGSHCPENWIASCRSLEKRGLIQRKSAEEIDQRKYEDHARGEWCCWTLTPAGEQVVGLLKTCGMFVEADAAINKKTRRA